MSGRPSRDQEHRPEDSWFWRHGLAFAYTARATGDLRYLAPILDGLETFGRGWEDGWGNRWFTLHQLWSIPTISLLRRDWKEIQDEVLFREAFRASLSEADELAAWSDEGPLRPQIHGEASWTEGPRGRTLRTHGTSWVSYPAPRDILLYPGTLSLWVKKEASTWGRKPWPWYSEVRDLVHVASPELNANALDVMVCAGKIWARLYDPRGWEIVALSAPSPWDDGQWHHLAVVWNRSSLSLYLDGKRMARDNSSHLPAGGQVAIHLGWRPGNWYGQAGFHDLRLFRAALTPERVERLFKQGLHGSPAGPPAKGPPGPPGDPRGAPGEDAQNRS